MELLNKMYRFLPTDENELDKVRYIYSEVVAHTLGFATERPLPNLGLYCERQAISALQLNAVFRDAWIPEYERIYSREDQRRPPTDAEDREMRKVRTIATLAILLDLLLNLKDRFAAGLLKSIRQKARKNFDAFQSALVKRNESALTHWFRDVIGRSILENEFH